MKKKYELNFLSSDVKVNGTGLVYFDNGATTQKPQAVIDAEMLIIMQMKTPMFIEVFIF